uniref:Putative gamma-interferon inducible lysosomal thiol reductase n=2 Tax=Nyssomyia neivai TaxID=330878 RepID=A0A1L8E320_9DIPT
MHLSGITRIRVLVIIVCIVIFWLLFKQFLENQAVEVEEIVIKPSGVPVVVGVYYEALCPDSKHFVVKQLKTTHDLAPQLIDIDFIPYGKASTEVKPDGSLKFTCQHGQIECEANIIHACTIDVISDPDLRLNMVTCMIRDNIMPKDAFHRCAKENNIDVAEKIQKCYSGPHGAELLKLHGEKTNTLRPRMEFVPTVTLDGGQYKQALILKNLFKEVCKVIAGRGPAPDVCAKESLTA